jgi:hypothetical protein
MFFVLAGGELRTDPGEQVDADMARLTTEVLFWGEDCGLTAAAGFAESLGIADP